MIARYSGELDCEAVRGHRPSLLRRMLLIADGATCPVGGSVPSRLYRAAILVWGAFAIAVSVKMIVSPIRHNSFAQFQLGSLLWWAGLNPYELSFNEFRYGPAFAVAFSPLILLPAALSRLVWMWLNLAAYWWALRVMIREILPAQWTASRQGAFLILVLATANRSLWCAQCNTLIFALVVAAMVSILHSHWGRAGLWLAIPVHIKVWPAAAALLLIACQPWRLALAFMVGLAAIAAIPLLTQPPAIVVERYVDWFHALTGPMQVRHDYRDVWTIFEQLHFRIGPTEYALLQLSTAVLVLALCLYQRRRGLAEPQFFTFTLGIWTAWQLLFGPGSERSTFSLIAPLSAWAIITAMSARRHRTLIGVAFVLMLAASIGQIERALRDAFPVIYTAHPVGVAIFACWLVAHARGWTPNVGVVASCTVPARLRPPSKAPTARAAFSRAT